MPRGQIVGLNWPLIRKIKLKKGSVWLLDSGDRIRPRVRLRYKTLQQAEAQATQLRQGVRQTGIRQLSPIEKSELVLSRLLLEKAGSKKSIVEAVKWYIEWNHVTKEAPLISEAIDRLIAWKQQSPRYANWLSSTLRSFGLQHGERRPGDPTPEELRAFIFARRDISESTRHNTYRA